MYRRYAARHLLGIAVALVCAHAHAQGLDLGLGADNARGIATVTPAFVLSPGGVAATIDFDFLNGNYFQQGQNCFNQIASCITVSRASTGTNLLPTTASGATITSFGNNVARITAGLGLLVEESRNNQLLNSTAPATQTTGSLAATAQTLWVNGSGSAVLSNGSATGCTGTATQGNAVTFTPTVGTCTVTVSGSLFAFQLEAGSFGTSLIVTAGSTATRAADVVTVTNVPNFGGSYTLFGKATPSEPSGVGNTQMIVSVGDNTINNRSEIYRNTASVAGQLGETGGSIYVNSTGQAWANSTSAKLAGAYAPSDQSKVFNGGAAQSNATGTPFSAVTTVRLGARQDAAGLFFDGYLERVALWPTTRLPNANLQAITQ